MAYTQIEKTAYERYQLDWMMAHGYSIQDILNVCRAGAVEMTLDGTLDSDMNVACDAIEEYLFEQGLNGNYFCSMDEFLGAEYMDPNYMKSILNKEEFEEYCKENKIKDRSEYRPHIDVETPHGTIRAWEAISDPEYPGIEIGIYKDGVICQGAVMEYCGPKEKLQLALYRPEDPFGDIGDNDIISMEA